MANVIIEDAQLLFKNFSGAPDRFHKDGGARQFSIRLNAEDAARFCDAGWNVKPLRSHPDDEEEWFHVNVKVNFSSARPPHVVMIGVANNEEISRTILDEDTVGILDGSFIRTADIEINEYHWTPPTGGEMISLYLNKAYVTVEMSPLDVKYAQDADSPF